MDLPLKIFTFKYHAIFVFIMYAFVFLFEIIFKTSIFSQHWILKLVGTICGYFFNDIVIKTFSHKYYFYFQNIFKYSSILIFQNIISKLVLPNYNILTYHNIFKINFVIFIYFLLDVIIDVNVKDDDKNKEMYLDIVKGSIGFYIVEKLLKNKLEPKDYIYIVVIVIGYYLYYTKFDSQVKELLSF